jgi:membrane protease YdiL (CAAX protease family)
MGKAVSIENLAVMSSGYIIISFLMGLTMGYIFYKTGNLWIAFVWHFFNDLTQNLLVVRNGNPSIEPAILNTSSALVKGLSFILLFIIINVSLKYFISFKVN